MQIFIKPFMGTGTQPGVQGHGSQTFTLTVTQSDTIETLAQRVAEKMAR